MVLSATTCVSGTWSKEPLTSGRQVVLPFNGESVFQPTATVNLAELVASGRQQARPPDAQLRRPKARRLWLRSAPSSMTC